MLKVAICGVANSGKTTLFNLLTASNERVGNWHGVTTTAVSAKANISKFLKAQFIDLPGSYFSDGYTLESKIGLNVISQCDVVLIVCEGAKLQKGLELLNVVRSLKIKHALIINFYGELKKLGGKIDVKRLEKMTNVPIFLGECNKKSSLSEIKEVILRANMQNCSFNHFEVNNLLKNCFKKPNEQEKLTFFEKIFFNPYFSVLFLFLSFCAFLFIAFSKNGLGSMLESAIEKVFICAVYQPIQRLLIFFSVKVFIKRLILEGILMAILAVIVFLPRLLIVQIYYTFLEESGLLSKIAFSLNFLLQKCGLSGRAIFALLSCYGCTVSGALCTNGLESKSVKNRLIGAFSFIPCSAKAPVFLFLLSFAFKDLGIYFILLFYILGLGLTLFFCFINFKKSKQKLMPLIIEIPPFRIPSVKCVLKALQNFAKGFIIKVGLIISVSSAFLWILKSVSINFTLLSLGSEEDSILYFFAKKLCFLFKPILLDDYKIVCALICGLFAKEGVISCLTLLNFSVVSPNQALSLLIFFALYPPCVSALTAIKEQSGIVMAIKVFLKHIFLAYFCAFAFLNGYLAIILVATFVIFICFKKLRYKIEIKTKNV